MDHRVRGAYAFKGGFLQYYVSDSPAALKHYLTETTVTDGSDSYTSGDYDFKWTGSSTWTETLAPPRPNKANGVVEWTDPSTWSGSYSFSYSEVSDEENYSYTRSGSGSRAAGGEWSGRHTSTTRSGSTISSSEGPGSGWDPGEPDHFVSASPTVEVREGSGFPNTTFTYTLSNEYTTEALISDVEFAITDYSEWLDSWWGWGGYEFDFWGWEYGTAWEESWEDGKDNYWERWRVAYRELSPNEVFYRLQVGEYRFNFNPSFKTEFKWNEVFVPQEVLTMADKEKANKLIKVHASHEITPGTQSPGYTIDPRDSGENGHYYLAPTSELIAFEPGAYEPSDEVEREKGIEVRNAQANYAVLDVPWSSIPGCTYSLSWLHGSAFKVFACYYDEDGFLVEEEITSGQQFVEGRYVQFRIYAASGAKPGDETKVTLTVSRDGTELNKSSAVFVVPDYRDRSYPGVGDASFPIDEAGGSRYRKVALNGTPLPDSKPQQTAETDQEPEQTFVDAMTLRLNHSVTDVYLPVPGSDIPLSARRDAVPEIWSERSGLRPQEDPSKPFGACWSTNLAPMVKITFSANNPQTNEPIQVHAIDEAGGSHLFVGTFGAFSSETEMKDYFKSIQASAGGKFSPSDMAGFLSRMVFVPLPAARSQQSPNVGSFSSIGGASTPVLMLKRKYGTTILYEISDFMTILPTDRLAGSQTLEITLYGRARLVRDRVGNSFSYGYSSSTNLVPSSITGGGMSIAILQDTRGLVTKIWDANGNETRFNYISHTYSNIPGVGAISLLDNVVAPGGKTTHFTYDIVSENDLTPNPPDTPPQRHWHCEIASIKDPLGNEYDFGYTFDHSKKRLEK